VYVNATLKLGEHFIFDLSDCNREILMDSEYSYSLFAQAIRASGLTVVDEGFYKFSPHGFTCFLLLAESHAVFMPGPNTATAQSTYSPAPSAKDMTPLLMRIKEAFGADDFSMRKLDREASIETQLPIAV
jgi:S-adenosylmethionine/arginine decarboxylase-like enzyme